MLFLLSLLSTAEAEPINGFRVNACAGIASHCPYVGLGLAYNTKRVAVDIGGFVGYPFGGHAGLQVYPSGNDKNRWFVGASVGGSTAVVTSIGGYGGYIGRDFHLLKSRKLIITPRIGYDIGTFILLGGTAGTATEEGSTISFSLEAAYAF